MLSICPWDERVELGHQHDMLMSYMDKTQKSYKNDKYNYTTK